MKKPIPHLALLISLLFLTPACGEDSPAALVVGDVADALDVAARRWTGLGT